jgi:hypothetical protein
MFPSLAPRNGAWRGGGGDKCTVGTNEPVGSATAAVGTEAGVSGGGVITDPVGGLAVARGGQFGCLGDW